MQTIDKTASVGELVAEDIGRAEIFERWGIDFCCGGGVRLEDACAQRGIPVSTILADLEAGDSGSREQDAAEWSNSSLTDLADHIVSTHHEYLRSELPRLGGLARKVADAHGELHPELNKISQLFAQLAAEMEVHSGKEEMILFPYIRAMDASGQLPPRPFGSVKNPILVMESDHDSAGAILAQLRTLSHDYTPPADGCASYRALYHGLEGLERDLHIHIHKENNILFPKAVKLEAELESRMN